MLRQAQGGWAQNPPGKLSRGGVLSDFYSPTKIEALTSLSGLCRVRLCSVSIWCDDGQGMQCPTPSLHPPSPAQSTAQAPRD